MSHVFFPHQRKALAKIKDNPRPALFLEMRLGKTPVIIRWAKIQTPETRRVLVVAPMATLDDWEQELLREGVPSSEIVRLDGMDKRVRMEYAEGGRGWYLINYEGVRVTPNLAETRWDALIVDESTAIRNPQAQITKVLIREYANVPCRAILSGNPAPESPMNYFSQFHFLLGQCMGFGNFWAWRNAKFKQSPYLTWEWMPKPGTRDAIKQYVHDHAVVMTRKQMKIGGRKVYERRTVDLLPHQKKLYKGVFKDFAYGELETNFATVRDLWLARISGGFSPDRNHPELIADTKIQELIGLMKGELKNESVVVWFRFNEELEAVVKALNRAKIEAIGVTGAVPREERPRIRQQFKRGDYQVICVQIKLGKMGWDLSRASTAIYYSNAYDWESRSQSEDRIIHPTKSTVSLYIDVVTRGTIEEEVVRLLREKRQSATSFMRQLNAVVWAQYWKEHPNENSGKEKDTRLTTRVRHARQTTRRVYPGAR